MGKSSTAISREMPVCARIVGYLNPWRRGCVPRWGIQKMAILGESELLSVRNEPHLIKPNY